MSAAAGAPVAPASITTPNGGSQTGPAPIPSKGQGHSAYEAVTVQRGATSDPNFTKWTNSSQEPQSRENSQLLAAGARTTALTPALVAAACAKDPSLRILGISGSSEPITFVSGHTYTIWGCSFGSENPNNAVYLSDGGVPGSAFIWYLQKISWGANSVVVQVSTAPSSARSNLMLFVLGQNGNTKLNGIALKP